MHKLILSLFLGHYNSGYQGCQQENFEKCKIGTLHFLPTVGFDMI